MDKKMQVRIGHEYNTNGVSVFVMVNGRQIMAIDELTLEQAKDLQNQWTWAIFPEFRV